MVWAAARLSGATAGQLFPGRSKWACRAIHSWCARSVARAKVCRDGPQVARDMGARALRVRGPTSARKLAS
eukprot:5653346-Pyramimonas_sp.AAC.1